jgi:hypothetical protein
MTARDAVAQGLTSIAHAILPNAAAGHDAAGGTVDSLTEAVMGVTAGLVRVAEAINSVGSGLAEIAGAIDGLAEAFKARK